MAAVVLLLLLGSPAFVVVHGGFGLENVLCPPTSCTCLGHLVDCSERGLIDVPPDLPGWVEILELQNNDITSIPDQAFKGLGNLQQLDLSHNQLREVNASATQHLANLKELKIEYNRLTEIPQLGPLPNLTLLSLHHNEIHIVGVLSLELLPNLRSLYLNHNRIVELSVGSFPNNTYLLHLYLNSNRIVTLERGCLDNLTHMETLRLNKNRIQTLPKDLFIKLRSLKTLELNRNKLTEVEGLSFYGLESLQVLRLQNNAITSLLDGAFWGLSSIQQLKLDSNSISVVSKGWLYGLGSLQQLSLRHNRISEVEENGWEFCQQLWELDLAHNHIQFLHRGTLSKLGKLIQLNLNYNRISYIEEGAFRGLHSLKILELNHNEISWAIEDMHGMFSGVETLTHLGLDSNMITSIAKRSFSGLENLKHLNLSNNAISSIENGAFQDMRTLQQLRFNTSSFLCDCQLQWMPDWLQQAGFQTSVTARCAHPDWLKGKSIFDVKHEEFTCDDFPKPRITEEPQTQISLKGANVSLVCRAASSSNSPMIFLWKKDNINLKEAQVETVARVGDGDVTEYDSVLLLWKVSGKDEGRYQCVISNQFGSTYSQKAQITVHVFPTFLKMPSDVTVKAGSTARLECAARGQPQPLIAWQKDGGDGFPAARERRMHVMPTDDVFFIVNVKGADMGVYSCTASNAAGTIVANASVTVLETPSFVKVMEDKEVRLGETAVLECMASGSPKPRITWLKDGGQLQDTERHFFTADNQLLIVVDAQSSDGGSYTCEMSNTLGTERGTTHLTVIDAQPDILDEGNTTTGIIIIAVVCCVVGTSLVWVIIIYQTHKRRQELSPMGGNMPTHPPDLNPFPAFTTCTAPVFQGSAPHLYIDNSSEHSSSKDSNSGDSSRRSHDALLPRRQTTRLGNSEHRRSNLARGPSAASLMPPPSNSSLETLSSSPSTHSTTSSRPTNHERLEQGPGAVTTGIIIHPEPPSRPPTASGCEEDVRWATPLGSLCRTRSAELPQQDIGPQSTVSSKGDADQHEPGYATFPRHNSPARQARGWYTDSLRHLRLPREIQNDSGSFSIDSGEDTRPLQHHLLIATPTATFTPAPYQPVMQRIQRC